MSKVKITYYGHSCFRIQIDNSSIVLDPYADGSVPGLKLPSNIEADIVSCSHSHADHNAEDLIHLSGNKFPFHINKITTPHDHHNGQHRGMNDIVFIQSEDLVVAHLGDLGRLPMESEYSELRKADIILLPCADYYTISSKETAKIISNLKTPCLKILMHYREGKRGYDVQESILDVEKDIKNIKRLNCSEIIIDSKEIKDEIITLDPLQ